MAKGFRKIEDWAILVESWKQSGLSVKNFCENEGIGEGRFYEARKEIETGISRYALNKKKRNKAISKKPIFLPITLKQEQAINTIVRSSSSSVPIEVTLGSGHCVRFPSNINKEALSLILMTLVNHTC